MSTRSSRRRCAICSPEQTWPGLTISQHSSGNQKAEEEAKKDTDVKVKEIEQLGSKSGSKVVDQLIEAVVNAHPEPLRKE